MTRIHNWEDSSLIDWQAEMILEQVKQSIAIQKYNCACPKCTACTKTMNHHHYHDDEEHLHIGNKGNCAVDYVMSHPGAEPFAEWQEDILTYRDNHPDVIVSEGNIHRTHLSSEQTCRRCGMDRMDYLDVDHINPDFRNTGFDSPENWQTLCYACHKKKTATEDRSAINAKRTANRKKLRR